jgi:hypothetical protein
MFLIDALVRVQPSGQRAGLGWAGHPFHTLSFSGLLDMQFWSIGLCIRVYFPGVGRRAYLGEVSRLKKKKKKNVLRLQNWEPGDYSGTRKVCHVLRARHNPLPVELSHDPLSMGITYAWSMEHLNIFEMGGLMKNVYQKRWPMVKNRKWRVLPVAFHFLGKKRESYWDILKWHPKMEYKKPNKEMPRPAKDEKNAHDVFYYRSGGDGS